jgi:tartrate dehydratase beta subunit/fumarate hydratase class I family protein
MISSWCKAATMMRSKVIEKIKVEPRLYLSSRMTNQKDLAHGKCCLAVFNGR